MMGVCPVHLPIAEAAANPCVKHLTRVVNLPIVIKADVLTSGEMKMLDATVCCAIAYLLTYYLRFFI